MAKWDWRDFAKKHGFNSGSPKSGGNRIKPADVEPGEYVVQLQDIKYSAQSKYRPESGPEIEVQWRIAMGKHAGCPIRQWIRPFELRRPITRSDGTESLLPSGMEQLGDLFMALGSGLRADHIDSAGDKVLDELLHAAKMKLRVKGYWSGKAFYPRTPVETGRATRQTTDPTEPTTGDVDGIPF